QSTSPAAVRSVAHTLSSVAIAPEASTGDQPTHVQVSHDGSSVHWWISTHELSAPAGGNPRPVSVTGWPSTRSAAGVTSRTGGTTSAAGSNPSGTVADLAGVRRLSWDTASTQAPGMRQSTSPRVKVSTVA